MSTAQIAVFGQHEEKTIQQLNTVAESGPVAAAALMADGHFGYSQPIGGVVAYRGAISPSGVGYDIACGNKAAKLDIMYGDIKNDLSRIADEIFEQIEFGVGKQNNDRDAQEHPVFEDERWKLMPEINSLKRMAANQLGTIGSGNHYVDLFVETDDPKGEVYDDDSPVWVGVHFGSRGFGHKVATGFLNLAHGLEFGDRPKRGEVPQDEPTILTLDSMAGMLYTEAMDLAGEYAYAGRDYVVDKVAEIIGVDVLREVHNHHNFAWREWHEGEAFWVVRKGSTPMWPGQQSFIGGSMCDIAVIARGVDPLEGPSDEQKASLMSTVHGAGRVMGRMQAKGKRNWKTGKLKLNEDGTPKRIGKVTYEMMHEAVTDYGIELRGGDLDESPFVYRKLGDVLANHTSTTEVTNTLRPIVVCMAGEKDLDPYKDQTDAAT